MNSRVSTPLEISRSELGNGPLQNKLTSSSPGSYGAFETLWAIYYHLHNLKNMKNTHGGVLLLVQLEIEACNFIKSNTPPWFFSTLFKLYKAGFFHVTLTCLENLKKSFKVFLTTFGMLAKLTNVDEGVFRTQSNI